MTQWGRNERSAPCTAFPLIWLMPSQQRLTWPLDRADCSWKVCKHRLFLSNPEIASWYRYRLPFSEHGSVAQYVASTLL